MIRSYYLNVVNLLGYVERIESTRPGKNSTRVRAVLLQPDPTRKDWDVRVQVVGHGKQATALLEAHEQKKPVIVTGKLVSTGYGGEVDVLVGRVLRAA